jgi:hypothetical protein
MATQVEARELPRHVDVRMTMKYTHIGLQDQAEPWPDFPIQTHIQPPLSWVLAGSQAAPWVRSWQRLSTRPFRMRGFETNKPLIAQGLWRLLSQVVTSWQLASKWRRRELHLGTFSRNSFLSMVLALHAERPGWLLAGRMRHSASDSNRIGGESLARVPNGYRLDYLVYSHPTGTCGRKMVMRGRAPLGGPTTWPT